MDKFYRVPAEYWQRIHFVRPRFKGNIENVLLYMAHECCKIGRCSSREYNEKYFNAIRSFKDNIGKEVKTLNNWRTEIPALFGFYKENKHTDMTETTAMAKFLNEHQDLTQFMRFFLFTFQFPGGHLKSNEIAELINSNIRFKPAQTIIKVLLEGNKLLTDKEMSLSGEEAAYCILNDRRVTSGVKSAREVAETILNNRKNKLKYYDKSDPLIQGNTGKAMSEGDVRRYASDIMDYMEIASILEKRHNYYYLKPNEKDTIETFVNDKTFFDGYEPFYGKEYKTSEISAIEPLWFEYVNNSLDESLFKTDLKTVLGEDVETDIVYGERISDLFDGEHTKKDVGNLGESIVCCHEKMRLKLASCDDGMIKRVQIVDSPSYHPGFDIDSFEGDGTQHHRYVEVKTTISHNKIDLFGFHMSPNEWSVAETTQEHYCVYRLMISRNAKQLFVLRNPVGLYKNDKIQARPTDGMEVSFDSADFKPTKVLQWEK